ncbi:hypothetical protein KBB96_09415 [Luteolibacter ambystomatis]|uniref:Fibronectin type-III domain-containing protein n=1 Tax=Luteolibacter ambystomatis TaxID=2824561 RepID=A0A975PH96_9BACT|nr:choice-of-anchor tandem repeat GloVer-containing protein [Luteolibacter ambystomatis]QUE53097.1 hypothetical protein KBB96_09415 [Luteolibacter ambystomatis]
MFRPFLFLLAATATTALHAAPVFQKLREFTARPSAPDGALVLAADGNFYGISRSGGDHGYGTVFRMTPAGVMSVVGSCGDIREEISPMNPDARAFLAPDGTIYGTSYYTMGSSDGVLFRYSLQDGFSPATAVFHRSASAPGAPNGRLVADASGNLYGKAYSGGNGSTVSLPGFGGIYRIAPGGAPEMIHSFDAEQYGQYQTGLVAGPDGAFYGFCLTAGSPARHTFFRITTDGTFTPLAYLEAALSGGPVPTVTPTLGPDGAFYAISGPDNYDGALIRLTTGGEVSVIAAFAGTGQGARSELLLAPDGNFYGTTAGTGYPGSAGTVFRFSPTGTYTLLHTFQPDDGRGYQPSNGLALGPDGQLYGTTWATMEDPYATHETFMPLAYKISTAGTFTVLRSFGADFPGRAANPLLMEKDGRFVTAVDAGGTGGTGGVLRLQPDGGASFIASYDARSGSQSAGNVTLGRDGNYYGTTSYRGGQVPFVPGTFPSGTFYRVTPDGTLTALAAFSQKSYYGAFAPVQGADGNFYAAGYGYNSQPYGDNPVILKLSPRGGISLVPNSWLQETYNTHLTPLRDGSLLVGGYGWLSWYTEDPGSIMRVGRNGATTTFATFPYSLTGPSMRRINEFTPGPRGSYYTYARNVSGNSSLYRLEAKGALVPILDPFPDDYAPAGSPLMAADGNFYGVGTRASDYSCVLFRITPDGGWSVLDEFTDADRTFSSGLLQGTDGHLYGLRTVTDGLPGSTGDFFRYRLGASATIGDATGIVWNGATLHGTVDPAGTDTTVGFQLSLDPEFRRPVTVKAGVVTAGQGESAIAATATRLLPGRTYWVRVVTVNAENPVPQVSEARTFTTPPRPSLREIFGR